MTETHETKTTRRVTMTFTITETVHGSNDAEIINVVHSKKGMLADYTELITKALSKRQPESIASRAEIEKT